MKNILQMYKDEELIELLKNGKNEAFDILYERYWEKMFNVAYSRLYSEDIAKEIVQDVFTSLWIKRNSLQITNFSAYIFSALKYSILDYIRSRAVKEKYVSMILKTKEEGENSTEEKINGEELEKKIQNAINGLPDRCKTIFTLSRYEDYSMNEIAEKLDLSPKTVENQLGKALKQLREDFRNYCMNIF